MKNINCKECHLFKNGLKCNYESDCEKVINIPTSTDETLAISNPVKNIKVVLGEDLKINSFESLVVIVGEFKFVSDDMYPWVDLYIEDNSDLGYTFFEQLDDGVPTIVDLEDLKVFAINWYFKNVEVIKRTDIEK